MSANVLPEVQANAFLKLLDRQADTFVFRVLPEGAGNGVKPSNHTGRIADLWPKLEQMNNQGGGVFVTINEGGRRANEITRVRAVFADTDGAPLEPIKAALEPHIVVESSPNRWHVYWLVQPDFPLDQFGAVQAAIAAKFGTDPSIKDLPRIMRLPGFLHQKHEPYLCQLAGLNWKLSWYSLDEIVAGLGLHLNRPAKPRIAIPVRPEISKNTDVAEVERALAYLNPFVPRDEWIGTVFSIAHEFGEAGRGLAHRWSRGDFWAGGHDEQA